MNPLSSELPFHVHNWLIISLKDFCIVDRKWLLFSHLSKNQEPVTNAINMNWLTNDDFGLF